MKTLRVLLPATMLLLILAGTPARAGTVVWDYSPATIGGSPRQWINRSDTQNLAERFVLASSMWITGMDIYSGDNYGSVGDSMTIRFHGDAGGTPGPMLAAFLEPISLLDTEGALLGYTRKHVDFSNPVFLEAGITHWVGMSGTQWNVLQLGLRSAVVDDSRMAIFEGVTFTGLSGIAVGDMAFRLQGQPASPVPLPSAAWAGLGLLGLLGAVKRYRRRKAA